jgi:hypothetical protein
MAAENDDEVVYHDHTVISLLPCGHDNSNDANSCNKCKTCRCDRARRKSQCRNCGVGYCKHGRQKIDVGIAELVYTSMIAGNINVENVGPDIVNTINDSLSVQSA